MRRRPPFTTRPPTGLAPGCFTFLACLLAAPLVAQEVGPEPAPARFRLSPSVGFAGQYNRVEGLPVRLGPVLERGGPNPFHLDAMAIWRSGMRIGTDENALGYRIEARQRWGAARAFLIGATVHSLISPIEPQQTTDLSASFSTFFVHRDPRDHFAREGFSGFAGLEFPGSGLAARVTYADEEHDFLPAGTPLAISGDHRTWRPQPLVAVGSVRTVTAEVTLDQRTRARHPQGGWSISGRVTAAVGGSLALPTYLGAAPGPADTVAARRAVEADFLTGSLDARRNLRFRRSLTVSLRALAVGPLDGDPLPPQQQHALGGVGSLPGYHTFTADCGARDQVYSVVQGDGAEAVREPAFATYGCDAVTLFRMEVGGLLPFALWADTAPMEDAAGDPWEPYLDLRPRWSLFVDTAKGWSMGEPGDAEQSGRDTDVLVDVGVGIRVEGVGLYWARGLTGSGKKGRLFLRLGRGF